jgi:hypothetical protein
VIAKALEKHPGVTPRIISDNGPQFIAKDFKEFVRTEQIEGTLRKNASARGIALPCFADHQFVGNRPRAGSGIEIGGGHLVAHTTALHSDQLLSAI